MATSSGLAELSTWQAAAGQAFYSIGRWRLIGVGAVAGVTAVGSAIVARRGRSADLILPDPTTGTKEAAASLHNAAKGTVISAIRAAEEPTPDLLDATIRAAIADAAEAGADFVPVAIGVTGGAAEISHLLQLRRHGVAIRAATSAVDAATTYGAAAGTRVRTALSDVLSVGGHEILPGGGQVAARWRPVVLPSGGQWFCPR